MSNRSAARWLLPIAVFAAPYLFIWQGLDFTDKGLMLAFADGMFSFPDAYEFMSPLWLTGALAHGWLNVVPLPPVLSLNVLLAVLMNALAWLSFRLLRFRFDASSLWCAILLSQLFVIPPLQNGYGYQALIMILLSIAAFALVNGLVERKRGWTIASGVLVGVAVFARLPNVIGVGLIAVPVIYAWLSRHRNRGVLLFSVGFAIGWLTVAALISVVGHWSFYTSGVNLLLNASPDDRYANAGFAGMLSTYWRDSWRMVLYGLIAFSVSLPLLIGVSLVFVKSRSAAWRQAARWTLALAAVLSVVFLFNALPAVAVLKDAQRLALSGLVVFAAIGLLRFSDLALRLMIIAGAIACGASFAGSDVGFGAYALYPLLMPVAAWCFSQRFVVANGLVETTLRTGIVFWGTVMSLVTLGLCATYVYRDAPRGELSFPVRNNEKLRGIYTSEPRRDAVEALTEAAQTFVKPGSTIWATPDMPMVYFLTSTKPFTNHPWDNLYNAAAFERLVFASESNSLPAAVVTSHGTPRHAAWPSEVKPGSEPDFALKQKIVADFLARYGYVKTWDNGFFQLWTMPPR